MTALKEILNNNLLIDSCIDRLHSASDSAKAVIKDRLSQLNINLDSYLMWTQQNTLKCIFNLSTIIAEQQVMSNQELVYLLREGRAALLSFVHPVKYLSAGGTEKDRSGIAFGHCGVLSQRENQKHKRAHSLVFPYYEEDAAVKAAGKMKIPLDAAGIYVQGKPFSSQNPACNPDEIAFEIMNAGLNVSWLYPEMPVVAKCTESREIFM